MATKVKYHGAVGGAVALTIIGFSSGMLVTSGKAETMAQQRESATRRGTCVKSFMTASDAKAKLAELKAVTSSYSRESFVRDGKWATVNNDDSNYRVVGSCTDAL